MKNWQVKTRDLSKELLKFILEEIPFEEQKSILNKIDTRTQKHFTFQLSMLIHYLNEMIEKEGLK